MLKCNACGNTQEFERKIYYNETWTKKYKAVEYLDNDANCVDEGDAEFIDDDYIERDEDTDYGDIECSQCGSQDINEDYEEEEQTGSGYYQTNAEEIINEQNKRQEMKARANNTATEKIREKLLKLKEETK